MADIELKELEMPGKPEKMVMIVVNQDEHSVTKEKIAYAEVVALYLQDGGASSTEYLIKYSRGHSANISGTLAPGQEVLVNDGLRFRVSGTGES
jgi:hypothetical protein